MPDYSLGNIWYYLQIPQQGDLGNACFEFAASVFIWLNVYCLYRDKELKGWSPWASLFFSSWGYWNIYYYAAIDHWYSWLAGWSIVFANTIWLSLMVYYTKFYKGTYHSNMGLREVDDINHEEHKETDQCGFDRSSSISEDTYVCNCGWRDKNERNPSR